MQQVIAIIEHSNEILIGKLKVEKIADFGGLKYVFPGGTVEEGEQLENAVIREVYEETGLSIEIFANIGSRVHPITNKEIHYFFCKYISGELSVTNSQNDDIQELIFVNRKDLFSYMPTLYPKVIEYLKLGFLP